MALPDDREIRLGCVRNALRNWNFHGYVRFKPLVERWLAREFPGYRLREIAQEMCQYVDRGGEIDEQEERRPEYVDCEYHYDLRLQIGVRHVYFEMILVCTDADDPDDPVIVVVSVHDV